MALTELRGSPDLVESSSWDHPWSFLRRATGCADGIGFDIILPEYDGIMSMSIRRLTALVVPVTALVAGLDAVRAGTSVTLRPGPASSGITNGDAFVTTGPTGNLSGNNYGGAGAWAVAASGSAKGSFASVMRFDTAEAKASFDEAYGAGGWRLDSAVLRLTTTMANNPIFNVSVPGQVVVQWIPDDSWVEGTGNPNNPSSTGLNWDHFAPLLTGAEPAGLLTVTNTGDGVTADYPVVISSGLRSDVTAGGSAGFAFTPGNAAVAVLFNSRSFGTASRNPSLILSAVPLLPEITGFQPSENPGIWLLTFTAPAGLNLIPQSSSDLQNWADSDPVITTEGTNTLPLSSAAPAAGMPSSHFWRLKRTFP